MRTSDKERKGVALAGMAENFGRELSPALLRMWLGLLEPYAPEAVEAAVLAVIENYEFKTLPPFAALKKELDRVCGRLEPELALELQARSEWDRLMAAVRERGSYRGAPDDLHPATLRTLDSMGGWEAVCLWPLDKLEWREKDFLAKWKQTFQHGNLLELGAVGIGRIAGPVSVREIMAECLGKTKPEALNAS